MDAFTDEEWLLSGITAKVQITFLNSHSAGIYSGTRFRLVSTLRWFRKFTATNRVHFVGGFSHYGEFALGAFDGVESYLFDFVGIYGVGSLLLTAEETETNEDDYHQRNDDKAHWL